MLHISSFPSFRFITHNLEYFAFTLLLSFILLNAIISASSANPNLKDLYFARILYHEGAVESHILEVRIGLSKSCIQINNDSGWDCGSSESLLLESHRYYTYLKQSGVLLSLVELTAEKLRESCSLNHVAEMSVGLASVTSFLLTLATPQEQPKLFRLAAFLSLLGALISFYWTIYLQSSVIAAKNTFSLFGSSYYRIVVETNSPTRTLMWAATSMFSMAASTLVYLSLTKCEETRSEKETTCV